MGTCSLTAFIEKGRRPVEICTMYRQYDGYPKGHGVDLAEFIDTRQYNGLGCLTAQVIAHFKKANIGGVYIEAPGGRDFGEEYIYEVYTDNDGGLVISCYDVDKEKTIFIGTPEKFIAKYKVKETA